MHIISCELVGEIGGGAKKGPEEMQRGFLKINSGHVVNILSRCERELNFLINNKAYCSAGRGKTRLKDPLSCASRTNQSAG